MLGQKPVEGVLGPDMGPELKQDCSQSHRCIVSKLVALNLRVPVFENAKQCVAITTLDGIDELGKAFFFCVTDGIVEVSILV